jgi:putative membrane protein
MISKTLFGAACAAMIMVASGVSSAAYADTPKQFLQNAIKGDNSEIMLGRIAQRKADSPSVQEFGKPLFDDHSKAKAQAAQVADRLGISVPGKPMDKALEERDRLVRLSGEQFDREFVRYMVADHRHDIADFRKEAAAHMGMVSRLAQEQLPTLKKHLDMAVALNREPKVAEAETR